MGLKFLHHHTTNNSLYLQFEILVRHKSVYTGRKEDEIWNQALRMSGQRFSGIISVWGILMQPYAVFVTHHDRARGCTPLDHLIPRENHFASPLKLTEELSLYSRNISLRSRDFLARSLQNFLMNRRSATAVAPFYLKKESLLRKAVESQNASYRDGHKSKSYPDFWSLFTRAMRKPGKTLLLLPKWNPSRFSKRPKEDRGETYIRTHNWSVASAPGRHLQKCALIKADILGSTWNSFNR